jgi:hypothetical protein
VRNLATKENPAGTTFGILVDKNRVIQLFHIRKNIKNIPENIISF